jgi:hypothetical protein
MPAQIKFGIEGGINISNVKGKDPSIIGGTSGFFTGVKAGYDLLDFIFIESGFYISQKGMGRILFSDIQGIEKFNYLEIPLNLFYILPIPESGKTSVFAGVYAARLISADITPDNSGQSSVVNLDEIIPINDYGLNFGIRQSLNVRSGLFNFGIKYSFGLKSLDQRYDVVKYGEHIISDGSKKLYNSVVAINVGYTY